MVQFNSLTDAGNEVLNLWQGGLKQVQKNVITTNKFLNNELLIYTELF